MWQKNHTDNQSRTTKSSIHSTLHQVRAPCRHSIDDTQNGTQNKLGKRHRTDPAELGPPGRAWRAHKQQNKEKNMSNDNKSNHFMCKTNTTKYTRVIDKRELACPRGGVLEWGFGATCRSVVEARYQPLTFPDRFSLRWVRRHGFRLFGCHF